MRVHSRLSQTAIIISVYRSASPYVLSVRVGGEAHALFVEVALDVYVEDDECDDADDEGDGDSGVLFEEAEGAAETGRHESGDAGDEGPESLQSADGGLQEVRLAHRCGLAHALLRTVADIRRRLLLRRGEGRTHRHRADDRRKCVVRRGR